MHFFQAGGTNNVDSERELFIDQLQEMSEAIEESRKELDWSEGEEESLIRMQRHIDVFVSDASQEYEDE